MFYLPQNGGVSFTFRRTTNETLIVIDFIPEVGVIVFLRVRKIADCSVKKLCSFVHEPNRKKE